MDTSRVLGLAALVTLFSVGIFLFDWPTWQACVLIGAANVAGLIEGMHRGRIDGARLRAVK